MTATLAIALGVCAQSIVTENTLSISSGDVTMYPPITVGAGKYYKLELSIPQLGSAATLETAHLEFYVDAESFVRGEFHWLDADSVEHVGYKRRHRSSKSTR
jgi:hypothetical protein